jgi:hypothetical protein
MSEFPELFDVVARDPSTNEILVRGTSIIKERLDAIKTDFDDRFPGADISEVTHEPDLLDIPTFLRRA